MTEFSEPPSVNGSVAKMTDSDKNPFDGQSSNITSYSPPHAGNDALVDAHAHDNSNKHSGFLSRILKPFKRNRSDTSLREVIEEAIENGNADDIENPHTSNHERLLISNILNLRDLTAVDVMVPRADIVSIDASLSQSELLAMLSQQQKSRFPVYTETLDDVIGTIHIKDILAALALGNDIVISDIIRNVPIIAPSLPVLDLLVQMRETKKHMVLVVDEFGGIDGLVTIGDIIEAIIGEIDDEYDKNDHPKILEHSDGSIVADGRVDIEEFEERFGHMFSEEEHEDADTLGGLVFTLAGRVPARGEVLLHETGMEFEVLDADPRRIQRLKIRNIPDAASLKNNGAA